MNKYVSINVASGELPITNEKPSTRFTLLTVVRYWRRCTNLQKKVFVVIFSALIIYTLLQVASPSGHASDAAVVNHPKKSADGAVGGDKVAHERVKTVREEELDFAIDIPHQLVQLDGDQRKILNELEKRVGEDVNVLQSPIKKPPPKLIVRGDDVDIKESDVKRKGRKEPPMTTTTPEPVREPDPPPAFKLLGAGLQPNEKQTFIKSMFSHAWKAYKLHAWGHDHLHPISRTYDDWFHVGLTMLDSLDTMYIMGMEKEYLEARDYVARTLTFDRNTDVNLFECTIRVLGSMLSSYHLTGDEIYKEKAIDIGDRLMPAMSKSRSPIPYSDVNLHTHIAHDPRWGPDSTISEVTSIQLEFRDLTFTTENNDYKKAVDRISKHVANTKKGKKGDLVPMWINANTGNFRPGSDLTVGARADSYYEYLLKQWIQTGQKEVHLLDQYLGAIDAINKHLVGSSKPNGFVYVGELISGVTPRPKMDHLVCFLPGTLALGASLIKTTHEKESREHMQLARDLMRTCVEMYKTPTGLAPEITYFNLNVGVKNDLIVKPLDRHNLLRPETVESLFYLWRLTKEQKYRDWGWEIAQAFEKHTKVANGGYTSINNVLDPRMVQEKDKMESFFLGETLKYLYLLFSDDDTLVDLNKWVFNTEAHPLPIRQQV